SHRSSSGFGGRGCMIWVVRGASGEHRASNVEETVGDASQGPCPGMPPSSQSLIFGAAALIVLNGFARPVVDGVLQAPITGMPADDVSSLARLPGHRGNAGMAAQSVIVSLAHRLRCLCEQRGEDDPADSWRGAQDRHVTLHRLPRRAL